MADLSKPDRDLMKAHPLLRERWARLGGILLAAGIKTMIWEVYRSDERQAWLYGQGRTADDLKAVGLDPALARAGDKVTNAYSSALSAHGWRMPDGSPASAAFDLVPLGDDEKPWTPDDPWDSFVATVAQHAKLTGLRHFAKPGKPPWDKPHVQLQEWDDKLHRLLV